MKKWTGTQTLTQFLDEDTLLTPLYKPGQRKRSRSSASLCHFLGVLSYKLFHREIKPFLPGRVYTNGNEVGTTTGQRQLLRRRLLGTSQLLNRQGTTNRLRPDPCPRYLGHILLSVHSHCWPDLTAGIVPVTHVIDPDVNGKIIAEIAIALLNAYAVVGSLPLVIDFFHNVAFFRDVSVNI